MGATCNFNSKIYSTGCLSHAGCITLFSGSCSIYGIDNIYTIFFSIKHFFSISKNNLLEQHYLQQITNTYTLFLLLTGMICLFLQESSLSPHYSKISQIFLNIVCEPHGLVNCHLSHTKLVDRRLASWDIDIFLFWDLSCD